MKLTKGHYKNLAFLVIVAMLITPQTRTPIQVFVNKGLALFGPSVTEEEEREAIGEVNWVLMDSKGETLPFETLKGKVTLVNFWATWCPLCIAEMPSMQELYNGYKDKIAFVFISDERPETVSKFLSEKGYTFSAYKPLSKHPEVFNVRSIPRTFLIDASGNIVIDKMGAANWNSETVRNTIDDLLDKSKT